jgi:hypothetical protein
MIPQENPEIASPVSPGQNTGPTTTPEPPTQGKRRFILCIDSKPVNVVGPPLLQHYEFVSRLTAQTYDSQISASRSGELARAQRRQVSVSELTAEEIALSRPISYPPTDLRGRPINPASPRIRRFIVVIDNSPVCFGSSPLEFSYEKTDRLSADSFPDITTGWKRGELARSRGHKVEVSELSEAEIVASHPKPREPFRLRGQTDVFSRPTPPWGTAF